MEPEDFARGRTRELAVVHAGQLLKLVPGQSLHIALTLRQHREHSIVTISEPDLTELPRPKLGRYRQQSRLFLIYFALINKNQALIRGNKAAHPVTI